MNKKIGFLSAALLIPLLSACGGSGKNNNPDVEPPAPAADTLSFTGSFINGATYTSGVRTGITGEDCAVISDGCFDVLPGGDTVTFKLGSITLPSVPTLPGQQQVSTLDVARALGETAVGGEINTSLTAIYAILDILNTGEEPDEGETRVFVLEQAVMNAPDISIASIVDGIELGPDEALDVLKANIAQAVSDSTGKTIELEDINTDAVLESDIVQLAQGFEGGIQPQNPSPFEETDSLSFITSDLLGLWSADNEDGINGLFYSNDGKLSLANTRAASLDSGSFVFENVSWNIVNSVFVSQSVLGERQCVVTERTSAIQFVLKCVDFSPLSPPPVEDVVIFNGFDSPSDTVGSESNVVNEFTANYNKINLQSVLTNGDGKWNFIFEERFDETGTITFDVDGTFIDSITQTENNQQVTDSASGEYMIVGLFLKLDAGDEDTGDCAFAGARMNDMGVIEDIFLRCNDEEDVLLTKRMGVEPLNNTDRKG